MPNLEDWSALTPLGDEASETPGLCAWDERTVFALWRKGNDVMRCGRLDLDSLRWTSRQAVGRTQSRPALARLGSELYGLHRSGSSDDLWSTRCTRLPIAPVNSAGLAAAVAAGGVASGVAELGDAQAARDAQARAEATEATPAWTESRVQFSCRGQPALVEWPPGQLFAVLPSEHGLVSIRFEAGGWTLPAAIPDLHLRDDRACPALAVLDEAVHLVASVRNHRSTGERALEVFIPVVGTAFTAEVEHVAPHWRWDGASWTVQPTGFTAIVAPDSVGLAALDGRLHLVLRTSDGGLSWYFTQDGSWVHGGVLAHGSQSEPTLVAAGNRLVLFSRHDDRLAVRTWQEPRPDLRARAAGPGRGSAFRPR